MLKQSELAETAIPSEAAAVPGISPPLQRKPLITIGPSRSRVGLNLADFWAYRELLYFLAWRDVKVRYKQTVHGVAWAVLQPALMMITFSLFFGRLAGIGAITGVPYPLFAFAGLVPWTFFAAATTSGSNSLVSNAGLITKVYFPRMVMPVAAVAAAFVDFLLAFALLVVMLFYYRVTPTANLLALPALAALTFLFAVGVGMLTAALNVKYRDVRFVLPFVIQLWLFVSSVILPSAALPPALRRLLVLNPMSGIVEGYRAALFGGPFDWVALLAAAAITLSLLVYSAYFFRRTEKRFADII